MLELVPIQHCPFCGEVIETVRQKWKMKVALQKSRAT